MIAALAATIVLIAVIIVVLSPWYNDFIEKIENKRTK